MPKISGAFVKAHHEPLIPNILHNRNEPMKKKILISAIAMGMAFTMNAQQPKYLDTNAPMEERIEDALSRMGDLEFFAPDIDALFLAP